MSKHQQQKGPCHHIWSEPVHPQGLTDQGGYIEDPRFLIQFCLNCSVEKTEPTPTKEKMA
jgi:hypothetical protein